MVKLPHWPKITERSNIELGLGRVKALLNELDNPHQKLAPVIHVAGTNGKGSTIAFLKSIFEASGYKVHTYTSPHLVRYNERIKISGFDINDEYLYEVIEETRIAADKANLKPTFFEATTIAAFVAFSRIPCDIILLETGLGGRLDATNVIDSPLCNILTSISIDHTDFLGNHILEIAYEKSGIMKKNSPVIISKQYQEVYDLLEQRAKDTESETFCFEYDWTIEKLPDGFFYKSHDNNMKLPTPCLIGDHQFINAGNAIAAALKCKTFKITETSIIEAIQNVAWPARLQKLIEGNILEMLPKTCEIWVDGAHNEGGAHVLSNWLSENRQLPTYLIYGATKGRDCKKFLKYFKNLIECIFAVHIEAEALSYKASHIVNEAKELDFLVFEAESIEYAIEQIKQKTQNSFRIVVTGSLYLAGDILYQNQKMRI